MSFVRKVYAILTFQSLIIVAAIDCVQFGGKGIKYTLYVHYNWVRYVGLILAIICLFTLVCFKNTARMVPLNHILCFLFTVGMALAVAWFTIPYDATKVFMAGLAFALITVVLTTYAFCAQSFEISYGMVAVFILA